MIIKYDNGFITKTIKGRVNIIPFIVNNELLRGMIDLQGNIKEQLKAIAQATGLFEVVE